MNTKILIPHSTPSVGINELKAVSKVLKSAFIAQGTEVKQFEDQFVRVLKTKGDAVALNSGTSALHLALLALGVKSGDEVILPTYACSALLNAVYYAQAIPVLADADDLGNLSLKSTVKCLSDRTKAIIAAHMFGQMADLTPLKKLGIPVIEDCAQCVGASLNQRTAGTNGDISIFSFYATKVLTTGEGGMLFSRSQRYTKTARDLRDYDKKKDFRLRFNYKMTDLQAAMGLAQLKALPLFLKQRRAIAKRYDQAFHDLPVHLCGQRDLSNMFYRFIIRTPRALSLIRHLNQNGIAACSPVFKPLHRLLGYPDSGFVVSAQLCTESVSLPIYPNLSVSAQNRVIRELRLFFST